jgi:hypothetical protein
MLYSRRDILKLGAGAGAALALGRDILGATPLHIQEGQLLKTQWGWAPPAASPARPGPPRSTLS